jgi:protein-disulfide isomerase
MEAKKTKKVMIILMVVAVLIFIAVLFLNNNLESRKKNNLANSQKDEFALVSGVKQSYINLNNPALEEDDFYVGRKNAALKIFVYEDYTDIFSAELNQSLNKAKADFANDILFIYRPFNIKNDGATINTALALACAVDQDKGDVWRDKDFKAVGDNILPIDNFDIWLDELKLNKDVFQDCLANQSKKERLEESMLQMDSYSVYGAPTMFVGNEMIVGARPYQTFTDSNGDKIEGLKQVIERQLK